MLQIRDQEHPTTGRRRSVRHHAVAACTGVGLCYALLFGLAEFHPGPSVIAEIDPVQTASAEPLRLLGADSQDRSLDALASAASHKRHLDQRLAEQAQAFDEQRLKARRYEHALEAARHDIASLKVLALDTAAVHSASLEKAKEALAGQRQRAEALERQVRADESERARLVRERLAAIQERDVAMAAATRADTALERAGQQYTALERALVRARQAWEQAVQTAAADRTTLQQERDKASILARDFAGAVDEVRRLKQREAIRFVRASLPATVAAPMKTVKKRAARAAPKPKPMRLASRNVQQADGLLPASLLPTQPPLRK